MNILNAWLTIFLEPRTEPKPDFILLLLFQFPWEFVPTKIPELESTEFTSILLKVILFSWDIRITSYACAIGPDSTSQSTIGVSMKSLSFNMVRIAVNTFAAPVTWLMAFSHLLLESHPVAALSPMSMAAFLCI